MRFKNKVVIVTGGAAGIGKVTSEEFAMEGASVVIADIDSVQGTKTIEEMKKKELDVTFIKTDISKIQETKNLVDLTIQKYGQIDVLFNNAGIYKPGSAVEVSIDDWYKVMEINLFGAFYCSRFVLPHMMKKRDGVIINTASVGGLIGYAGSVAYQTSKGGLVQMTRYMATEYGEYNIRVNCIAPFMVDTSMLDTSRQELNVDMEAEKKLGALNRVAKPIEIANSVLFLAEEKSSYITGTVLTIDAGFTSTRVLHK